MRITLGLAGLLWMLGTGGCASSGGGPAAPRPDRLLNLYDAFGKGVPGTTMDWGFSCLVDYRGKRILFDSGTNADLFARNAEALGVDLRTIDFAVCSHAHADHVSGFDHLLRVHPTVKIYLPADFALGAPVPFALRGPAPGAEDALPPEQRYFGGRPPAERVASSGRFWKADVEYVSGHREIAPGITLIATDSPFLGTWSKYPPNVAEPKLSGLPELSLALASPEGEILVVGCSHSSVDRIVAATRSRLRRDVGLLVGGFHLVPFGREEIDRVVRLLKDDYRVRLVAPAHCTGHLAFQAFREAYGERSLFAGLGSELSLPSGP
jgi:7,8-dihydropterin-6-yl-methyl-4-(beta-D-ribofuranosyl)aminobenzene 5'-phosphate synthase